MDNLRFEREPPLLPWEFPSASRFFSPLGFTDCDGCNDPTTTALEAGEAAAVELAEGGGKGCVGGIAGSTG